MGGVLWGTGVWGGAGRAGASLGAEGGCGGEKLAARVGRRGAAHQTAPLMSTVVSAVPVDHLLEEGLSRDGLGLGQQIGAVAVVETPRARQVDLGPEQVVVILRLAHLKRAAQPALEPLDVGRLAPALAKRC